MPIGRVCMLVVVLTTFALPLAAQVAPQPQGVHRLSANVLGRPAPAEVPRVGVVPYVVQLPWYQVLWDYVKDHPALVAPLVLWLISSLSDNSEELGALLLMGAAVALIVWGLASLWESRTSQWFVWIGSAVLAVVAFGLYKVYSSNSKAAAIIDFALAAVGIPVTVLAARDKGPVAAIFPAVGASIAFARGMDKIRTAMKPPAGAPVKEETPPPKRRTRRKKAPLV